MEELKRKIEKRRQALNEEVGIEFSSAQVENAGQQASLHAINFKKYIV